MAQTVESTTVPGAVLPDEFTFPEGETFESGVVTSGTGSAVASVIDPASGTILQGEPGEEHEDEVVINLGVQSMEAEVIAPGQVLLVNSGDVTITASATATNDAGQAVALANIENAVGQYIAAPLPEVSATAINNGSLSVISSAVATGTTSPGEGDTFGARAVSNLLGGFHQEAGLEENTDGTATVTSTNNGTLTVSSSAAATAEADVEAIATNVESIYMRASGNGASDAATSAVLTNNGLFDFSAEATGVSTDGDATAFAEAGGGEHGLVHVRARANGQGIDTADVTMTNAAGADIRIIANAEATAFGLASATASGGDAFSPEETLKGGGLVLKAQASGTDDGDITSTLVNSGDIRFDYFANALSTGSQPEEGEALDLGATATAGGNGAIDMIIEAGGPSDFVGRTGIASLTNASGGVIAVSASAIANSQGESTASAILGASVYQQGEISGEATLDFANAGTFVSGASAQASGLSANATSAAEGVRQAMIAIGGANAGFANSGGFTVVASSIATGTDGAEAKAEAVGYDVVAEPLALTVVNSGTFTVNADALSSREAEASATGMEIFADIDASALPPEEGGGG
ncbi:MAG: hypothetical protein V2I74_06310, partial [Erythrobacter sp.]|nr:hypothetical protein [Erythrobacter sp.]